MPEYLTPGVYVEETSFRSKSIEGVSTSTTAFVGPTRRGPAVDDNDPRPLEKYDTPELVTSFGEFQRVYGGLDPLEWADGRPNYLAHAVSAYFENGGARLYVARVVSGKAEEGRARSRWIVGDNTAPDKAARFVARFPGAAGNGSIVVKQIATPASQKALATAAPGSLLQLGGKAAARPAALTGAASPFAVENESVLVLKVNGFSNTIVFRGESTEATGETALADTIDVDPASRALKVTIDGGREQIITLPDDPTPRAGVIELINRRLRGGYARLTNENKLVIGSERRGSASQVKVTGPGVGFPTEKSGQVSTANTVGDLDALTIADVNAAMTKAGVTKAKAVASASNGRLEIQTDDAGENQTLEVVSPTAVGGAEPPLSAHAALGFTLDQPGKGVKGSQPKFYMGHGTSWKDESNTALDADTIKKPEGTEGGAELITFTLTTRDADGDERTWEGIGLHRDHPRWIGNVLAENLTRRADALQNLFAISVGEKVTPFELRTALLSHDTERSWPLDGGSDGSEPGSDVYKRALEILHRIDDISIVAAPGAGGDSAPDKIDTVTQAIHNALISHVETQRTYRIAVLDTPPNKTIGEASAVRSRIDSKKAALYYPWVVVPNPLARPDDPRIPAEISLPPSGFVAGIYARTDVQRGVHKPPANEVVLGALRFETDINFAQQGALNPMGVNCFRFFPGRGYRLWGARTVSSDPEWKYVNVRRYFNYVEHSIDRGTQWAVFEPNGERLWANIRETVSSFLYNEWFSGALLGANTKEAYFVRCDRSTMTQNDLDNGRLVCLIGIAALKPAEFVIFRIGQKTADARG